MALVQMQPRPENTGCGNGTVVDAPASAGPKVWGDMTVEVALSVMAGARAGHLLVCDADDQCTGLVTLAQLVAVRDSSACTDRVRLRDVVGGSGLPSETPHPLNPRTPADSPPLLLSLPL
ncbi:CBS domain-containing protein [Streptomyces sp. TRM49041]|uniref:CBS domain-containing protein n=1 Tax=Streptomyces sp. TRM49041 TaxID=2603216 RepID=UPI0021CC6484|nr:CBS domain-containing protein [Streptomyces sp. TRM49041]